MALGQSARSGRLRAFVGSEQYRTFYFGEVFFCFFLFFFWFSGPLLWSPGPPVLWSSSPLVLRSSGPLWSSGLVVVRVVLVVAAGCESKKHTEGFRIMISNFHTSGLWLWLWLWLWLLWLWLLLLLLLWW